MKQTLPLVVLIAATPAFAEDSRQLDSHEHGVGELNIAVDGTTVAMELHAPGADIVGFEYAADGAEDLASIDAAIEILSRPFDLFAVPADAGCSVVEASAELESEDTHDDHDHEEDHDGHEEDADHMDDDDHDDHEGEDHADHDEHAEEAGHTEFYAEYVLECANLDALTQIEFAYFDAFENALEVEVQIVSTAGAQAFEVERDAPLLDVSGLF